MIWPIQKESGGRLSGAVSIKKGTIPNGPFLKMLAQVRTDLSEPCLPLPAEIKVIPLDAPGEPRSTVPPVGSKEPFLSLPREERV